MPPVSLLGRARDAMRRWALRRQGPDWLPLQLSPRRIYIVPTGAGWNFALLIAAMFVAGMNYGNGLVLLLSFWMTGFALVAMIQTQRSLATARILAATAEPAFAGGQLQLTLQMECRLAAADLALSGANAVQAAPPSRQEEAGAISLQLAFPAQRRGRWRAPVLRLETRSPFGLFRTWTWLALDISSLVYPRPAGEAALPESEDPDGSRHRQLGSLDELAGLRPFREGDSPRQVAWKAYARGSPLLVREYHGQEGSAHVFDFSALSLRDTEARLSQLTRWIIDTASRNLSWTLRLPDRAEFSGHGTAHRLRCLEALSLHGAGSAV
ncbi:MAG TPA: DUF58 domain-containing protein [Steroidobacteraceae bacterium]|nr:DUF58 domain-containing protein [Steroidobacteraceae bacterium]